MPKLVEQIKLGLKNPLPGASAQIQMAPNSRKQFLKPSNEFARQAAVLILIFLKHNDWHVAYIRRVDNTGHARHRGQISFPGGTRDPEDNSFEETALRETWEEIGIPNDDIQVLGPLTPLFIPVSNFNVHPFIGFTNKDVIFTPQLTEVADILEIPISLLQDNSIRKEKDIIIGDGITLKDIPFFDLNGLVLWGATAMITSEFIALLEANKS